MSRKIVFITSGHSPFSSRLFSKELMSLKRRYDGLTIIAPYDKAEETFEGIRIIGIQKYRSRYNRWSALKELFAKALALRPDIVHCHEPDSLAVAYLLKKRLPGLRAIYDCHEFHPQSFSEKLPLPVRGATRKVIEVIENYLASRTDAVITVNEKLVERFSRINKRVILLPNYPQGEAFNKERSTPILTNDTANIVYAGQISAERGIFTILQVLSMLKELENVRFTLLGKFKPESTEKEFWAKAEELGVASIVDYKGYLSHLETVECLKHSDIGLFLQDARERYEWGEPIKYFEYSAAGLPLIMSDLKAKRDLIEKNQNGLLVAPGSIQGAVESIQYILAHRDIARKMGENGRKAFFEKYNWESVESRLLQLYEQLT